MVAALDNTLGQFTADLLLLALVGVNAYLGWKLGLVRRVVAFIGLYVGVLAATQIGNGIASMFAPHSLYANAWAFIGMVAFVVLIFEGLGWAFQEKLQRILVVLFDRITGAVAGVIIGLAQALVLFLVALAVANAPANASNNLPAGRGGTAQQISSSTLAGQVVRMAPQAETVFSAVLPDNLSAHLIEGTQVARIPGV